jgi:cob(I)alamin adenosyltransferase
MVVLNRIYTRTGDDGSTALGNGERRPKHDLRVAAYGTVDEVNAAIGMARLHTDTDQRVDAMLARIQNDLFDLGADLCRPENLAKEKKAGAPPLRLVEAQVLRLEREIDEMNAALQPLESFVLPGGSAASAYLHLARTIARRAERAMTTLAVKSPVNPIAIKYINRLSDHLFVLARYLNGRGEADILWRPGAHR